MKLQAELTNVVKKMETIKDQLPAYAAALKASGNYKDFETRLAWDCMYAVVGSSVMCEWHDKYNCDDTHITTLAKAALKQVYTIV